MFSSFRFSTDDLPMQTRSAAVRELRERGLIPLEPLPGHAIHVAVSSWFLPGAGLLVGRLGGLRQEAGAQAVEDIDDLFLASARPRIVAPSRTRVERSTPSAREDADRGCGCRPRRVAPR
jgi:hypothetical protein